MTENTLIIRPATRQDLNAIGTLHRTVARISQGIARTESELTNAYFTDLFHTVEKHGLMLIAVDAAGQIIGEIHAAKSGLTIFDHNLIGLTIVVHPDVQGKGIGKQLFSAFLTDVQRRFPEVRRVELESRASNEKSTGLYRSMGFVDEGRMKNKTRNADGSFEDSLLMAWYGPQTETGQQALANKDINRQTR